jgi:hypothetical protein
MEKADEIEKSIITFSFDIQCFLIIDFEMKHQISTIQT